MVLENEIKAYFNFGLTLIISQQIQVMHLH